MLIKGIEIGKGITKICATVSSQTEESLIKDMTTLSKTKCDLIEWRADYYNEDIYKAAETIHKHLSHKPLIFTLRDSSEGGMKKFSENEYTKIIKNIISKGIFDIADLQLSYSNCLEDLISFIHSNNKFTLLSKHDFKKTDSKDNIINVFNNMYELKADILKVAYMPNNFNDVLVLMNAAYEVSKMKEKKPLIAISMSKLGTISRFAGELFGSAITYSPISDKTAPGQIDIEQLENLVQFMHANNSND